MKTSTKSFGKKVAVEAETEEAAPAKKTVKKTLQRV